MPLYEYECQLCHRRIEKIQKFADAPLTVCPHCGGHIERTITAPAIQFKGSGWYKDLYSSAKPAAASGSESGAATATDGGGAAGKSEGGAASTAAAPAASTPAATATPTTKAD